MRYLLRLLAVLSILHSTLTQPVPHDIHCNFQYRNGIYYCLLSDINIITEEVPLRFFNVHLPNLTDSDVRGIDTSFMTPRNVNIRVIHTELIQRFSNVQFIQLTDSRIEFFTTHSFAECNELIDLSLDRNLLSSIPAGTFQNCTKLQSLDLKSNTPMLLGNQSFNGLQNLRQLLLTQIDGIETNTLRHMEQLEIIEISDSPLLDLSSIQSEINGKESLQKIILNRNGFTSIDFLFFEQFQKLEDLELSGNQLTTIPSSSFQNYKNLKNLRLHSNRIQFPPNNSFVGLQNLEVLTLNDNALHHVEANTFQELVKLQFLDISDNFLPGLLRGTFNGLQRLDTLFLNNIRIVLLESDIFEPLQNLQKLHIIGGNLFALPPNIFTNVKKLNDLHLGGNRIPILNSNSFGALPYLTSFLIEPRNNESFWNESVFAIERNFFNNFPLLVRFGGHGNMCFSGIVNITAIDFEAETEFDRCFYNWDLSMTPTTTTPVYGSAISSSASAWLVMTIILITSTVTLTYKSEQ